MPDAVDEVFNRVMALRAVGRKEEAAALLAGLMAREPDNHDYRALLADLCGELWFQRFDPLVKSAMLTCFADVYAVDLLKFYTAWVTTVFMDPACSGIQIAADQADLPEAAFFEWLDHASSSDLNFIDEDIFLDGLRLLQISNPFMEDLLTKFRKWLCLNARRLADQNALGRFEGVLTALAEQCFYNEYVYTQTDAELAVVNDIIANGIEAGGAAASLFALVGCYRSLNEAFPESGEKLSALANGSPRFAKLNKTQFLDPQEERRLAAKLKTFGGIVNPVSQAVRAQYEDNPYPRWISASSSPPVDERAQALVRERSKPCDILIAGCGTGKQVLNALANFPAARITAADISSASLAYAQRKTTEAGLSARVDYVQADILALADWPVQFDIIECVGVLHHMQDPFAGWEILTDRLKPGGMFRVGLYSATARKDILEGQRMAQAMGLAPTPEGIRAFRQKILGLPEDNRLRTSLLANVDFFSTSAARDLFFHVQERRFTLAEISEMLGRLGLGCTSFLTDNSEVAQRFAAMFPQDAPMASLENWQIFERQFPETFLGMYQFWCRKAA